MAFAYDTRRWKQVGQAEQATRHVVNWIAREGGGLIATCYLQTHTGTELSRITQDRIHLRADVIVESMMSNMRKRDPVGKLELKQATFADNYPVIRMRRSLTVRSLEKQSSLVVDGLVTAWRGYEILLECGYPGSIRSDEKALAIVVQEIDRVLRTLHFER